VPILGTLSDRFDRRPVRLLSNAGLCLDYIPEARRRLIWFSGHGLLQFQHRRWLITEVTPPEQQAIA
jgi:hypothetical protein